MRHQDKSPLPPLFHSIFIPVGQALLVAPKLPLCGLVRAALLRLEQYRGYDALAKEQSVANAITVEELERVLQWEENWFHEVTDQPITRLSAVRMVRHAVWYLRSRHRTDDDLKAAKVLLHSLAQMKMNAVRLPPRQHSFSN